MSGHAIGLSRLLQVAGYEYYGEIRASKKGVQVMVIDGPDQVFELYERSILSEQLKMHTSSLK